MSGPADYEWFDFDGKHDAELPHHRDPRTHPWGAFTRDDSTLASVGMFFWFSSLDELAAYIREVEPITYGLDDDERAQFRRNVAPALEMLLSQGGNLEAARTELNAAQDYFIIEWLGTFEALTTGDGEWESELRAESRPEGAEGEVMRPIEPEELDGFVEYVAVYGY